MKPYTSLFSKDNNERHSSMPQRKAKPYLSIYDQGRRTKKILERNLRNGKNAENTIPPEYFSIMESEDNTSKPNTIQPIFVFNIINGDNLSEILHGVMASIKTNAI